LKAEGERKTEAEEADLDNQRQLRVRTSNCFYSMPALTPRSETTSGRMCFEVKKSK